MYNISARLQLPLGSTVEDFKVTRMRLYMTIRDTTDSKVKETGIQMDAGRRKGSITRAVEEAENRLKHIKTLLKQ